MYIMLYIFHIKRFRKKALNRIKLELIMLELIQVYRKLYEIYGKQNWWPITPKNKLVPEYTSSLKKLTETEILEICLGAILTQNTSWQNVEKALININQYLKDKKQKLSIDHLNDIDAKTLSKLIQPSGYYNQKTKYIKFFAEHVLEKHKGSLKLMMNQPSDNLRQELLELKGIGKETCDSIMLYAANCPIFVVDLYTKRLFSRLGYLNIKENYDNWQNFFHSNLDKNTLIFNEYHALIVEHNKKFCTKKPSCTHCPLNKHCEYNNRD